MSFRGKAALACLLALMTQTFFASATAVARGNGGRCVGDCNLPIRPSARPQQFRLPCGKVVFKPPVPRPANVFKAPVPRPNNVFGKTH